MPHPPRPKAAAALAPSFQDELAIRPGPSIRELLSRFKEPLKAEAEELVLEVAQDTSHFLPPPVLDADPPKVEEAEDAAGVESTDNEAVLRCDNAELTSTQASMDSVPEPSDRLPVPPKVVMLDLKAEFHGPLNEEIGGSSSSRSPAEAPAALEAPQDLQAAQAEEEEEEQEVMRPAALSREASISQARMARLASKLEELETPDMVSHEITEGRRKAKEAKKRLRMSIMSGQDNDDVDTADDYVDRATKLKRAEAKMVATACTTRNPGTGMFEWRSLRIPLSELGAYGVGVQLYFEYVFGVGVLFFSLFMLSFIHMYYFASGTLLEDIPETKDTQWFYKIVAMLSPANLGTCPKGECLTTEELMYRKVSPSSRRLLRDVTPLLGNIDLIALLAVLAFQAWFKFYYFPKIERLQDEAVVTAADYAVEVSGLPRHLKPHRSHKQYAELLKQHFMEVLERCGVPADPDNIVEVALVREYDGCISSFAAQGQLLEWTHEAQLAYRKAKKEGNEKLALKHKKLKEKYLTKVFKMEDSFAEQNDMQDEDREVCGAFVMFNTETMKEKVIDKYAASSTIGMLMQPKVLRFQKKRLRVKQACEPTELYWENMDYAPILHKLRKWLTLGVSFSLVVLCVFVLNFMRSTTPDSPNATTSKPHDMWIFSAAEPDSSSCVELCELRLSADEHCQQHIGRGSGLKTIIGSNFTWQDGSSVPHVLIDGSTECSFPSWRSPDCNGGPGLSASVAFVLEQPVAVRCLNVAPFLGKGTKPKLLKMYGCSLSHISARNDSGIFDDAGRPWSPEGRCIRYDDVASMHFEDTIMVRLPKTCLMTITLSAAEFALKDGETWNDVRLKCFCSQQTQLDPMLRIPGHRKTREAEICSDWVWNENAKVGVRALGIIAVMLVNAVLLLVFSYMDALGRYRTATEMAQAQTYNLFLCQFMNTAVVYVVVGMNLHEHSETRFFETLRFGKGSHDDFSPHWFVSIGCTFLLRLSVRFFARCRCL
eukprot:TRINITY_DN28611_c0_g1_i1.p1 TRINITY_DN28611_c0_g1~~TRINITY_DN28611_c0_g1_i1.p1  ORF type:complete len:996 (-),score=186.31 TRINITY_DN28611_c0_g1_i1:1119-4106(-)